MTIKAQPATYWTAEVAATVVREVVPAWVRVDVDEHVMEERFEVWLSVPWWRRGRARRRRSALLVLAGGAVAGAPAGMLVSVGWR